MSQENLSARKHVKRGLEELDQTAVTSDSDSAVLASLGYKQEFKRVFTPLELFGITFGVICPFPSITAVLGDALPNGGPVALVWGWAVCAVFVTFIALTLAELGSAAPTSGGLYYWTHIYASPRWRGVLSWIVAYCNTVGYVGGLAAVNWGCATQILAAASIGSGMSFLPTNQQTFAVFVALLVSQTFVASLASRVLARLQRFYIVLNVLLCLVIVIALPIATPEDFRNPAEYAFGEFTNLSGWPNGWAFMLSFLAPLWTIAGFDSSVHLSEEASNAAIAVPWAIILSSSVGGVLGWGVNVAIAFCMGQDVESIVANPIGQPVATILFNSFGQRGTLAVVSFSIIAQYFMGANTLVVCSRLTFAFARDGGFPFSSVLYRMHPRTHTPVNCVFACAGLGLVFGLLALAGPDASSAIFSLSMAGLYVSYIIPVTSRFLGGRPWVPGPFTLGRWGMPVAVIAVAFMAFTIVVFSFPESPAPSGSSMNYTVVVLGAWVALCLVYYYFPVYGGVHWFNGPRANIKIAKGTKEDVESASDAAEKESFD
ncbi:APC amino acid permease [Obba rivulosa]|uniref:APC amino acid permease n=1 Tax=Obba rivulosa TaxID=1052685 RepID=A0A8E2AQ19_9APHY|nr:APC amino acid permease [Obba rivulosa]